MSPLLPVFKRTSFSFSPASPSSVSAGLLIINPFLLPRIMKPHYLVHEDDYFLFCQEEKDFMKFAAPPLFAGCASGELSWDNPILMMVTLLNLMGDYDIYEGQKWNNFPTHGTYLKSMLDFIRKKLGGHVHSSNGGVGESNTVGVEDGRGEGNNVGGGENNDGAGGERPEENVPVLILRRKLNKSDMSRHQQRVSMPCNQVEAQFEREFLRADELARLRAKEHVAITVVDPAGRLHEAGLRWTAAGTNTHSFAIGKPWNEIKRINGFREGMEIGIWALRGLAGDILILLLLQH